MRIIAIILSILLGAVFIISALTKLAPIEFFEHTLVEFGMIGWRASIFASRLLIGIEFASGVLLICNLWLRRFTLPFVILLLILFTIYLVVQLVSFGNAGNCGCFGNSIEFTPLQAIIKNVIMLVVAGIIYRYHTGFKFRYSNIIAVILVLIAIAMPFIVMPVDMQLAGQHYGGELNYKLELDILYHDTDNAPPKPELRQGKWVIAYMSLTCPHCRIAAKKLQIMKRRNPALPIHLVLNGDVDNIEPFFEDTRADNLSWSHFNGADRFIRMAGASLPKILWVNNSIVVDQSDYQTLDQAAFEKWLAE